ncbi:putative bifunctional diguanylate cyclase/phosphodiesterase [Methylobacterium thuringiense]|uniref:Protein-glutamate methylesterase/protein-glutamine glutaminase n=1 Tax=Methylobacterium thuringiense TaxID=1003091 RepID=A0ABQ4TPA8_9HYPH|nr:EAL domain-containing protein [Methylobacterium thuringiense]GJE57208.1 Protein-glutamate methylesterase/protein-glutamine glutaminase [Methylobacterium thuringiense]
MNFRDNLAIDRTAPAQADAPVAERQKAARLLIVDDIADNRTILLRRFSRRGFEVAEADGGARALEMIERHSYDVILLDVMMPDIDGIAVLKAIRARYTPLQLPVIMVTAKAESENVVEALNLEANDYVTKPVDFEVALARVNAQVDRKRAEEKIASAARELRQVNDQLEQRVEERTRELVEINQQLQGEIVQRQQSEARSRFLAFHDPLTGLPNRRQFRDELVSGIAATGNEPGQCVAILFVDLDGFKGVNDTLGHSIGDMLLQAVGEDFRAVMERSDRIARLGGDEFAILQVGNKQPEGAIALATRLIEIASRERQVHGHLTTIGASVGIVIGSGTGDDPEELLKAADLAMYRAKIEGRGTFRIFDPAMDAHVQARRSLELDLRNAQGLGQFEVFYQPQISLSSRKVCGFEALIRWRHPTRGMVSPAEFIPLAEEIGLIVPIGEWVLREACREAVGWPAALTIAVNVSSVQFMRGSLVPSVISALAYSGLPAERLEIEITESVLLQKTDKNIDTLNQLRALGVRISMDDFGTGYSSLSYLRMFQFDKLKIDRSFIEDVTSNRDCSAIVSAILGLGTSFGIPTIAEGVETEDQLAHLTGEGCTEVQGRIFSMPISATEARKIIERIGF